MPSKPSLKAKHCLIIWLNGIGDLVMAIPALCQFQDTHRFKKITLLCKNPMGGELLSQTNSFKGVEITTILTTKKRPHVDVPLMIKLRKLRTHVGITIFPHQGISSALLMLYSGAKNRYQHEYRFKQFYPVRWGINYSKPIIPDMHISIQMNHLLNNRTELKTALSDHFNLPQTEQKKDIGIHCRTGAFKSHRNWDVDYWKTVLTFYLDHYVENIHVFWGHADTQELNEFKQIMPSDRIVHHYALPIPALLCQLKKLKLFIGIDSGVGHIAAITGGAQISLFGPFNETYSKPLNNRIIVIRPKGKPSNFVPYLDAFDPSLININEITVSDVIDAMSTVLNQSP